MMCNLPHVTPKPAQLSPYSKWESSFPIYACKQHFEMNLFSNCLNFPLV